MKSISLFFFNLTKRNWGAPWHFIGVNIATLIFIVSANVKTIYDSNLWVYSCILLFFVIGLEIFQCSRGGQSYRGALEDMLANLAGYLTACIPLIPGSLEYIMALPLIIAKAKKPLICLDPGHGGKFTGAEAGGYQEKNLNIRYAHRIYNILEELGLAAFYTRINKELDKSLKKDLEARADLANDMQADLFVSLHCNAHEDMRANGFEIYTSPGNTDSDHVAEYILEEVEGAIPDINIRADLSDDDRDKEAGFAVLKKTEMPAVLIELGFITNPVDRDRLLSWAYLESLSTAIAKGIERCFK